MCGIAGYISNKGPLEKNTIKSILTTLNHRGPDSHGIWSSKKGNITLMHTRLSILDLSSAGHQPMQSKSGRYVLTYNGEIYNHIELRKKLNHSKNISIDWIGNSDTETLLVAIDLWGLEKTLNELIGMFAFGLYDKREGTITLARDRAGEKPLYYGKLHNNGSIFFSSELKAFKKTNQFSNKICKNALNLFLKYSSIPAPYSIYEDIYKLEPGTFVKINKKGEQIAKKQYWDFERLYLDNKSNYNGSPNKIIDRLEDVLREAVSSQMISDVPLGAFLSGGVDSSLIVALMQAQSEKKIKTFSIGFEQDEFNEAEHASSVAKYLNTDHTDLYVSDKEVLDVVPKLNQIFTEPFADSSQIPTYLVSKIAKNDVTVCLSGDAGDELFGGYTRYDTAFRLWKKLNITPQVLRNFIGFTIQKTPSILLKASVYPLQKILDLNGKNMLIHDKIKKGAHLLQTESELEFYSEGFLSHNPDSLNWIKKIQKKDKINYKKKFNHSFKENMMAYDFINYLPNDILTKVDRSAMSVSLETRVPMLDVRVIEFALSMPIDFKIRDGINKWALKSILYKYVPKKLIDRPKMGFGVPLAEWLRGPLKDWGNTLLDKKNLEEQGLFNADLIHKVWHEHQLKDHNWQTKLWDVLIFQSWLSDED